MAVVISGTTGITSPDYEVDACESTDELRALSCAAPVVEPTPEPVVEEVVEPVVTPEGEA